jgi:soluble lytic murein transglycosylase-like protein
VRRLAALLILCALPLPGEAGDRPGVGVEAGDRRSDPTLARLERIAKGDWFRRPRAPEGVPYALEIRTVARRYRISPSLLAALVRAESGFDRFAISHKGARGLGQLMPATARSLGVRDSFDPIQNLDGSARYLAEQLERFGKVRLALGAYNAGPERMRLGMAAAPAETRDYVRRVLRFEREYRVSGLP